MASRLSLSGSRALDPGRPELGGLGTEGARPQGPQNPDGHHGRDEVEKGADLHHGDVVQ